MGRWAFFNTDFEYKFVFGEQSSTDILNWSGKSITTFCEHSLLVSMEDATDKAKKEYQAQLDWLSQFPSQYEVGDRLWELTEKQVKTWPYNFEYETSSNRVEWTKDARDIVLSDIHLLSEEIGFELPDFEKYPATVDGTVQLWLDFDNEPWKSYWGVGQEGGKSKDPEDFYNWMLGCLIYHQMLYEDELSCSFEY